MQNAINCIISPFPLEIIKFAILFASPRYSVAFNAFINNAAIAQLCMLND